MKRKIEIHQIYIITIIFKFQLDNTLYVISRGARPPEVRNEPGLAQAPKFRRPAQPAAAYPWGQTPGPSINPIFINYGISAQKSHGQRLLFVQIIHFVRPYSLHS